MGTLRLRLQLETGPPFYVVIRATRRSSRLQCKGGTFISQFPRPSAQQSSTLPTELILLIKIFVRFYQCLLASTKLRVYYCYLLIKIAWPLATVSLCVAKSLHLIFVTVCYLYRHAFEINCILTINFRAFA